MAESLEGLNSMPWLSLGRVGNGWLVELAPIPPRDKFKYSYDLWSNGLAFEAFGIGRTYKASIRAPGYGDGLWLFNLDTQGRLVNASYTGTKWGPFEISPSTLNSRLLRYAAYRPEMHRLMGGTWLRGKWIDRVESSRLTYRAEVVGRDDPFYRAAMDTLDGFVRIVSQRNSWAGEPAALTLAEHLRSLPLKTHAELLAEATRFHRILGFDREIPVEPPELAFDHYHAIPLKVQDGCGGPCTFCGLYRRKIRVRTPQEVFRQVDGLAEYLGEELDHFNKVVLLEGDALTVPTGDLARELAYASGKFGLASSGFAHAFSKAVTVTSKTPRDLGELKEQGLLNVNLGLESGCQALLDLVKRGQTLLDFRRAVLKLCAAGIGVSINVMIGLGGVRFKDRHVTDTIRFVSSLPSAVTVFYSTLMRVPTSLYSKRQELEFGGPLYAADSAWQRQMFEQELGAYEYLFVPI